MTDHLVTMIVPGTEGYPDNAEQLAWAFESVNFAQLHRDVLHLLPPAPAAILDIGAGTGRDAAAFAEMGHRVIAVEPVDGFRTHGMRLHRSARIAWLNDSLPYLAILSARDQRFDVIMLTAVWMHLDEAERANAMPRLAALLNPHGIIILSLRHGPVPAGRRMDDVSAAETIALAKTVGLGLLLRLDNQPSQFARTDVTWTKLAFAS